jgi:hypothetical protein
LFSDKGTCKNSIVKYVSSEGTLCCVCSIYANVGQLQGIERPQGQEREVTDRQTEAQGLTIVSNNLHNVTNWRRHILIALSQDMGGFEGQVDII